MNINQGKSLVIAERVILKYKWDIVAFICLILFFIGLIFLFNYLGWGIAIAICVLCIVGAIVWFVIDIMLIYGNNHSPAVLLTYKNNEFTIYCKKGNIKFRRGNVTSMTYEKKKSYFYTPYYWSVSEYNYGTFVVYLNNISGKSKRVALKNVVDPDVVYKLMYHLLGWDVLEAE